jgi:glyoxylate reductase
MTKPKVLLLGPIFHAQETWNALSSIAELVEPRSTNRADFIRECQSGRLDGVVAVYRTFYSAEVTGLWDEDLVNVLPSSLRFCAHCGAGYDQIDVRACSARNPPIKVSNVPNIADNTTAETAVFLMLGALRRFNMSMVSLRKGEFKGNMRLGSRRFIIIGSLE